MRSKYADYFNHDDDAVAYDDDVLNEADPIRSGYKDTLDWVYGAAAITPHCRVLELGSGTGNFTQKISQCKELVCVDISQAMENIARDKVRHLLNRKFIREDILGVFESDLGVFDAIVSTYAVHHLTEDEKRRLFGEIWQSLNWGGRAVFGDLMLENRSFRDVKIREYRESGDNDTAEALTEEFFWYVDESRLALEQIGFDVAIKRFSDLSFGILAAKTKAE